MVVEAGELVVRRSVGLGVLVVCPPVGRVGCPGVVAVGAAGVAAGRQSVPSPGGGKGTVSTFSWLHHQCLESQLEHSLPSSLHSQQVRTSALYFTSLVQLKHDAKVNLW